MSPGCAPGSTAGTAATCRQSSARSTTSGRRAWSSSSADQRANDMPPVGRATGWPLWCCAQAMLRSSIRVRQDTPSTARWWMINANWLVSLAHTARTRMPSARFSRDRASTSAAGDNASTVSRQSAACTEPASGTSSDQPPAPSSSTRSRSIACRSSSACSTAATSSGVTPAGAASTMVWLNCSTGPSMFCSQRMIGVATTRPVPSSTTSSSPVATVATRASRATVCSVKTSRGRQITPAARARATTCMDRMLSPPRSKNESSTPTRSTPSTWA
ncbi:hypothetical protein O981_28845 [Mycobacterium avium 10-5560]|nr:hypothetical protein O981_28845 [Mycobacterium avium 10-5560]